MVFRDKLNGRNLFNDFGLIIQTGTAKLLEFPTRKEPVTFQWFDENGSQYDLEKPKFEDKEVVLHCAFLAENNTQFWQKYNSLFAELSKKDWQQLYIFDHDHAYEVFYKKSGNFNKATKRLKNVDKVFVKFDLTVQVKCDIQ